MMYKYIHNRICQNEEKRFTVHCVKPSAQLLFKVDLQKVDQNTGGKWLIHDPKRRKDNQLQNQPETPL